MTEQSGHGTIRYQTDERVELDEYLVFLGRTGLGDQYPAERFKERVSLTLSNCSITVTARNEQSLLVGVCLGLTDFAYFLFITDLGVDRDYEGIGIGTELITRIHAEAGGGEDICAVTISNDEAIGFWECRGFASGRDVLWKPSKEWSANEVG